MEKSQVPPSKRESLSLSEVNTNDLAFQYGILAGIEHSLITRGIHSRFMRKAEAERRLTPPVYQLAIKKGDLKEVKSSEGVNSPILVDRIEIIRLEYKVTCQGEFLNELNITTTQAQASA